MGAIPRASGFALALLLASSAPAQVCTLGIASMDSAGYPGTANSGAVTLSGDGRFVAFASSAPNLVPNDTNGVEDVFVRDLELATVERVSVGSTGAEGNVQSNLPSISGDGRFVVFSSWAQTLVAGDTNNVNDVFLHDRATASTMRVSANAGGVEGDGGSYQGSISRNGRWVAFLSSATNLVSGDVNGCRDVFLYDHESGALELVSVSSTGAQGDAWAGGSSGGPFASDDGRFVVFQSAATNMVPGDTNGFVDVFVRDRVLGTTERLSLAPGGLETDGPSDVTSISRDARFLGLVSLATNLVPGDTNGQYDSFVLDRLTGAIERVSVSSAGLQGAGSSWSSMITDDGRFAVFSSTAQDLVPGDTNGKRDVFRRDRVAGTTVLVSQSASLAPAELDCFHPAISADGNTTAFTSASAQLVWGDLNDLSDVFVERCRPFDAFCFGTSTACPCGNAGGPGAGCASASLPGARLHAVGQPSLAQDTLTLVVTGLPEGTTVAFLDGSGPSTPSSGWPFGDGLLCISPPNHVLALRRAVGHAARLGAWPGDPSIAALGGVSASGVTTWFQGWYRSIESFCTVQTFNLTNGASVYWYP